ncbi:MAG: DUF1587 domain-containing protein, partial [Planctomycetota bacterium]|nr:DUF1587 domain-containing protein [Planctomycetota bacterium]
MKRLKTLLWFTAIASALAETGSARANEEFVVARPLATRPTSKPSAPKVAQVRRTQTNHFRQPYSEKDIKRLFEKHCYRCHNDEKQKGEIRIDNLRLDFARERELWDKIEEQLVTNKMPAKKPFLSDVQRLKITDWINDQKGKVDWSSHRQAGHVTLPMLNRDEYENTVRALFNDGGLKKHLTHIDFFKSLPDDGVGDSGFSSDRDSPSLAMTSSRMEKYIRITEDV